MRNTLKGQGVILGLPEPLSEEVVRRRLQEEIVFRNMWCSTGLLQTARGEYKNEGWSRPKKLLDLM